MRGMGRINVNKKKKSAVQLLVSVSVGWVVQAFKITFYSQKLDFEVM